MVGTSGERGFVGRWVRRVGCSTVLVVLAVTLGSLVAMFTCFRRGATSPPERTVHDVTQLVQIPVDRVVRPRTTAEVQELLRRHDGPVSIGGGRFSMGGQIGTDGTLFLDMRDMDEVLALDADAQTIRVEAGITWRQIQEAIDARDLSVRIMQSYGNFTVGGTLSVNAHGRYVNEGPVVHSVRSLELVLADGTRLHASRDENSDVFFGAIGGYGGLGVITEVALDLAVNEALERSVERMPVTEFSRHFAERVAGSGEAVFFNADLYPPAYDDVVAITYARTDREVTEPRRLQPLGSSTAADRLTYWWVSEAPLGKEARAEIIDRMRLAGRLVVWRNWEASYDARGLEPKSRARTTYVLQEYFVPVERFDEFVPKMAEIFQRYDANVVNVSIRHASADPDTLLTWAPTACFAFVVYYKQGTAPHAQTEVGVWTREMIDAILSVGGTWYLPYQPHATPEQFAAGYPGAPAFLELKMRLDPQYTLRNRLWDRYLPKANLVDEAPIRDRLAAREGYRRAEDQTLLTLPEWYIVYSAEEVAAWLEDAPPSRFPWLASVCQFCEIYGAVSTSLKGRYPTHFGYHAMIWTIGASYALEYGIKGLWEGTVGRVAEAVGGTDTPEDRYQASLATEYAAFLHHTPWFAYPWNDRRRALAGLARDGSVRGLERRVVLWAELASKGIWGNLMQLASGAAYGEVAEVVEAWVRPGGASLDDVAGVEVIEELGDGELLVSIARYEPFTAAVMDLASRGVQIVEIAGGRTILVQVAAPASWDRGRLWGDVLVAWPVLTAPDRQRVALEVPVPRLHATLAALADEPVTVEHIYDY